MAHVLALASYPELAAASRFRLLAYRSYLEDAGHRLTFSPFLDQQQFSEFYRPGARFSKAWSVLRSLARRTAEAIARHRYDVVIVQREAALMGPALFEELLRYPREIPLVYDFDDAVWLDDTKYSKHPVLARLLKVPSKTVGVVRKANAVLAGSEHLANYARQLNQRVLVVPSVVSARSWHPLPGRLEGEFGSTEGDGPPVIGWIGTHTTSPHLKLVASALERLSREGIRFRLVLRGADRDLKLPGVAFESLPWRAEHEIEDFQRIDIGLAPLEADPWTEGKCGFKQLQYMAVGVPFVSSLVGGARDFLRHGDTAMIASSPDEWFEHLRALLRDPSLRARLASRGRQLVESHYSSEVQGPRIASLLTELVTR